MSAFIVSTETMQNAVNAIHMANTRYGSSEYTFCGVVVRNELDLATVGAVLFTLNHEAVNQRYAEDGFAVEEYKHGRSVAPRTGSTLAPYIKSLDCLIYQCSEGDVPEHDHFLQLEAARRTLVDMLLSGLTEYANSPWDA